MIISLNIIRTILISFIFLLATTDLVPKDIIILKNGSEIEGTITSMSSKNVLIDRDGVLLDIAAENINEVVFDNTDDDIDAVSIGLTLGYPSVINLTAAYSSNYFTSRISAGMIPGEYAGIQALLGYPIYGSKKAMIAPSLFIGTNEGLNKIEYTVYDRTGRIVTSGTDKTYSYYGLGLDIHFYGFTAFIGYGKELEEEYRGSKVIFDIGYKYTWY